MSKLFNTVYEAMFYARNKSFYNKIQYLDQKHILAIQNRRLANIIQIVTKTVPFYKPYNSEFDFKNFTLGDLKKLPIIDKAIMKKKPELFINDKARVFERWQTSGSTGEPFVFRVPRYLRLIDRMVFLRAMSNENFRMTPTSPMVWIGSYAPLDKEPLYKRVGPVKNIWRLSPFHINDKNLDQYIDVMHRSKASVLTGYPSAIYLFTLLLQKHDIRFPLVKVIKTASETLLPEHREIITTWWKLPVLDWYGQAEMTALVIQCPYGNYHNQDDYGICEINKSNELILTSLHNFVTPFIRYNSKDIVEPVEESRNLYPCKCGRNFSIPFKKVIGRSNDLLWKLDGTMVPVVNFCTFFSKLSTVRQFKIIQKKDYSIDILIVADSNFTDKAQIITGMQKRLGNIPINVLQVEAIPRNPHTMKQKFIESYLNENKKISTI